MNDLDRIIRLEHDIADLHEQIALLQGRCNQLSMQLAIDPGVADRLRAIDETLLEIAVRVGTLEVKASRRSAHLGAKSDRP